MVMKEHVQSAMAQRNILKSDVVISAMVQVK